MIKVALADDHNVVRRGIKSVLEMEQDIKVILEASNGKELLDKIALSQDTPDIILLDISMPLMSGIEVIDHLKMQYPDIHILVFSLLYHEDTIINMINKGACGYLSKNTDPDEFPRIIRKVESTGFYIGDLAKKEYFKQKSIANSKKAVFLGKETLTQKEIEFIKLSASNISYKEMADHIGVSPKTIENYRDSLFHKLSINNRAALAVYGFQTGLIDLN